MLRAAVTLHLHAMQWLTERRAVRVSVIGLGNMGGGMLRRLRSAGVAASGWDADAGKRVALQVPDDLGEAVADVVVLSLPYAAAVSQVLAVLAPRLPAGAVVVDTSTLDPLAARGFAQQASDAGYSYLDAPVSGGPAGANAGTLTMMVGGGAAALERARPMLAHLTARIIHVGEAGAGQVAKLVNNLLVATHLVTAAEAFRLGAKAGLSPAQLLPVVNAASGRSAATEVNWPRWIESGSFDSGFTAGLMRKDVRLALELAKAVDAPLDACGRAAAMWEALRDAVPDDADFNRLAAEMLHG